MNVFANTCADALWVPAVAFSFCPSISANICWNRPWSKERVNPFQLLSGLSCPTGRDELEPKASIRAEVHKPHQAVWHNTMNLVAWTCATDCQCTRWKFPFTFFFWFCFSTQSFWHSKHLVLPNSSPSREKPRLLPEAACMRCPALTFVGCCCGDIAHLCECR